VLPPRALLTRLTALRALPPRVATFQARCLGAAVRAGDDFALDSVTRPGDVAELLRLARGRARVVELGTAVGWTTGSLVLADPARRVTSFDPVVQRHRARYLSLLPAAARERLTLVPAPGADGAGSWSEPPVELLFVDSTHERDDTIAEVRAWAPHLAPDALVVLHDYANPAFPGVRAAVEALGLDGEVRSGMFVAPAPAG
jgi:predicted O-methyltransferase YrrM